MKAKLDAGEVTHRLAVSEALSAAQKERDALANELQQSKRDKLTASELAEAKLVNPTMAAKFAELKNSGASWAE